MKTLPGETGDFHEYARPDKFVNQFNLFDSYPTDRKALIGEYAVTQQNTPGNPGVNWSAPKLKFPTWIGTVSEAVFLLGAEKNADKIIGASYAPLLQNLHASHWTPDLISFNSDPEQTVKSTSYHLVELFSTTRLTHTLSTAADAKYGPVWWVAGRNEKQKSKIFKAAVYNSTAPVQLSISFKGVAAGAGATLSVLAAPSPSSFNEVGAEHVKKSTMEVTADANGVYSFPLPLKQRKLYSLLKMTFALFMFPCRSLPSYLATSHLALLTAPKLSFD
jgi:alpha-N-arabinofuranosidase